MNWTNYELYYAMSEKNETATRATVQVTIQSVGNGYVLDVWNDGYGMPSERLVFGSRVQLASWVASEMPKAKWEES